MNKTTLEAKVRKITGRKVKTLRKEGLIPANIYGKKVKSQAIQVMALDFKKAYEEAGETGLISLKVQGEKGKAEDRAVLVSNVQIDPLSDAAVHVDFRQVDLKEKVTASVPVELVGESPAEKGSLGTVVQYIDEIEVEALPTDLPEKFEVDASGLVEVDQAVFVSDLKYDKAKVEIKNDAGEIIVKVEPPQKEEVVAAPVTEEVPAEGEAPKEGEEAPVEGGAQAPEEPQEEKTS
ncbi:MAG: 50S ribosomal protein L25 [Candidatus Woesebacteria bacterium GW2011_GWC2_47_16]|uniref:Large ribosomal subunit protein bL25 n=1 Tax=Candidatus Woesebacteria bacterium GW2011_GWC2_47_16 TaxID=1618590 RepID=A0A0G1UDB0_9BACT|nr:MAG: 50S ribosomal protein L25 [Candidatus Woesebacteria bacterium GW2011_GWC2_47_16]